jgi:hypothetical protein
MLYQLNQVGIDKSYPSLNFNDSALRIETNAFEKTKTINSESLKTARTRANYNFLIAVDKSNKKKVGNIFHNTNPRAVKPK